MSDDVEEEMCETLFLALEKRRITIVVVCIAAKLTISIRDTKCSVSASISSAESINH